MKCRLATALLLLAHVRDIAAGRARKRWGHHRSVHAGAHHKFAHAGAHHRFAHARDHHRFAHAKANHRFGHRTGTSFKWWTGQTGQVTEESAEVPVPNAPQGQWAHAFFQNSTFQSMAGDFHFLYSMPPNLKQGQKPKGLFLMLHGGGTGPRGSCQKGADGFFRLPEESAMAAAVLGRGYAVAAPDSPNHPGRCWMPRWDARRLSLALQEAQAQLDLKNAPLYGVAIGPGSGVLASLVQTSGVTFNGLHFNAGPHSTEFFHHATGTWPRTSFTFEQGDQWASPDVVDKSATFLRNMGTEVQVIENGPHPLDDLPGLSRVLNVDRSALVQATEVIRKSGLTTTNLGPDGASKEFLAPHAANDAFEKVVETHFKGKGMLRGEYKALREELHIMDGSHGPTAEHVEGVLDFLLQQGAYAKNENTIEVV